MDSYKVSLGNAVVIMHFTVPQDNRDAGGEISLMLISMDSNYWKIFKEFAK